VVNKNKNTKTINLADMLVAVENAAKTAHEVNRAFCAGLLDYSQPEWNEAPEWQRKSARDGVRAIVDNPELEPHEIHEAWALKKRVDGWRYGEVKDDDEKTHPCMVPYHELSPAQQAKDALFSITVKALLGL